MFPGACVFGRTLGGFPLELLFFLANFQLTNQFTAFIEYITDFRKLIELESFFLEAYSFVSIHQQVTRRIFL